MLMPSLLHAAELRPHLDRHPQDNTLQHAGFDKGLVAVDSFFPLESDSFFDFLIFGKHFGIIDVSVAVKLGKNLNARNAVSFVRLAEDEISYASSQRSFAASQRGDFGKKNIPKKRIKAGTIWMPQGIRNAAVLAAWLVIPLLKTHPRTPA